MNRIELHKLTIGERIKYLRKEKGITQNELAEKSQILATNIRKYETNMRTPKDENLRLLAKELNCSIYDLKEFDCNSEEDVLTIISQPCVLKYLSGAIEKLQKELDEEINYYSSQVNELKCVRDKIINVDLKEK